MFKHINQICEQAFLLDFGSEINIEINNLVNLRKNNECTTHMFVFSRFVIDVPQCLQS